ncbi:hypothetical protein ACEXQD_03460 [Herbiconiux sp. P15]|uniref:hypothetical protein n=1 Tax=Herbiconiux liukaitaii TaxID=3342799 RepID=UPI0035B729FA
MKRIRTRRTSALALAAVSAVLLFVGLAVQTRNGEDVFFLVAAGGIILGGIVLQLVFRSQASRFEQRVAERDPDVIVALRVERSRSVDEPFLVVGLGAEGLSIWHVQRDPQRIGFASWGRIENLRAIGGRLCFESTRSKGREREARLPIERAFECEHPTAGARPVLHPIELDAAVRRGRGAGVSSEP